MNSPEEFVVLLGLQVFPPCCPSSTPPPPENSQVQFYLQSNQHEGAVCIMGASVDSFRQISFVETELS